MKTLYLDCGMGAAGDMMTAALLELLPEGRQEEILKKLSDIGLHGVTIERIKTAKCGITGSHMDVRVNGEEESHDADDDHHHHHHDHHHHHSHMHMSDIEKIIDSLNISETVKQDISSVYKIIAEAESHVHGTDVAEVHFHEVGMKDAIMDVAAVCLLMEELSPDKVTASPVHVGSGQVECAHGIVPVPAPATALILKGIPVYGGDIRGELCTPTGAALIKYFADDFGRMPAMITESIGYGMGSKDFPVANCLRALYGEALQENKGRDTVAGLSCNIDDMTGEDVGFAMERLFELGAKEVYTVPVGMKKSRPGLLLEVLCAPEDKEAMIRAIFKYTTTLGIRETGYTRHILKREEETLDTPYGAVRVKRSGGYGTIKIKPEYEDIAAIARREDCSPKEIRDSLHF